MSHVIPLAGGETAKLLVNVPHVHERDRLGQLVEVLQLRDVLAPLQLGRSLRRVPRDRTVDPLLNFLIVIFQILSFAIHRKIKAFC